jgi:hypothetical protein
LPTEIDTSSNSRPLKLAVLSWFVKNLTVSISTLLSKATPVAVPVPEIKPGPLMYISKVLASKSANTVTVTSPLTTPICV